MSVLLGLLSFPCGHTHVEFWRTAQLKGIIPVSLQGVYGSEVRNSSPDQVVPPTNSEEGISHNRYAQYYAL